MAPHQGANPYRRKQPAKNLFLKYCNHFDIALEHFAGIQRFDFLDLKDFFKLNLIVYELKGKVAKRVQRSREFYKDTMKLNVYGNHISLIVNFEQYCGVYQ